MRRAGIVWLLVLLMSACAPIELKKDIELKPGEGGLVMRMADASNWWSRAFLIVEREVPGKWEDDTYYVYPIRGVSSTSVIFADSLPAGNYKILRLASWDVQCIPNCYATHLDMPPQLGRLEIKPGQLTDLGAILNFAGMMSYEVSPDHALGSEFIQEMVPALRPLLTAPILGWKPQAIPPGLGKLYAVSKLAGNGIAPVRSLDDISYLSGSNTGVVYSFVPGQGRSSYDLGTAISVDSVLPVTSDLWLVGGEYGLLMQSRDSGQSWESLRGNLPYGAVVGLDNWKGYILATVARGNQIKVFSAKEGEKNWGLLASYPSPQAGPIMLDVARKRPESFLLGDNLITTLPGDKLAVLDLQRRQFDVRELPGSVSEFLVTRDGKLRCRCIKVAVFNYDSNDLGKSWVDSNVSRAAAMPVFRNERKGVAFRDYGYGPKLMLYTNDGGANWREATEVSKAIRQIVYSKDGSKVYAIADMASHIWMSADDGEHWQLVQAPRSN